MNLARMLGKIKRRAYRTKRRHRNALRRYARASIRARVAAHGLPMSFARDMIRVHWETIER